MSNVPSIGKFRTGIAWFALVSLAIHILLVVYFTVSPGDGERSLIRSFYTKIILLGPFFSEERIAISPHLTISFHSNGAWTPAFDYGHESFLAYHRSPWKFVQLKQNDYQRQLVRAAYSVAQDQVFPAYKDTDAFRRLHAYTMDRLAPEGKTDSVRMVYVLSTFGKRAHTPITDTVWDVTYNPLDIAPHR